MRAILDAGSGKLGHDSARAEASLFGKLGKLHDFSCQLWRVVETRTLRVCGFVDKEELDPFENAFWAFWPKTPYLTQGDDLWMQMKREAGLQSWGCEICGGPDARRLDLLLAPPGEIPAESWKRWRWHVANSVWVCPAHEDEILGQGKESLCSRFDNFSGNRRQLLRILDREIRREAKEMRVMQKGLAAWKTMKRDIRKELKRAVVFLKAGKRQELQEIVLTDKYPLRQPA